MGLFFSKPEPPILIDGPTVTIILAIIGIGYMLYQCIKGSPKVEYIDKYVDKYVVPTDIDVWPIFQDQVVLLIENAIHVRLAVDLLEMNQNHFPILSLDCEGFDSGQDMALIQLASRSGFCAIFDMHKLGKMPDELRNLLEDPDIWKVGVSPEVDVQQLRRCFGIETSSRLDLRNMARDLNYPTTGLKKLAEQHLGVYWEDINPGFINWRRRPLSYKDLQYAACDSIAGIKIFEKFLEKSGRSYLSFEHHVDVNFKANLPKKK